MIRTRLTDRLGLAHPVVSAPMARVAGGRLAAAVSGAGGLGLIGGGYGDPDWLRHELAQAGNARVGTGFISWKLAEAGAQGEALLEEVLSRDPALLFLSFGELGRFARMAQAAGVPVMAQVQDLAQARAAVQAGAIALVAQGTEAGGHGASRATLPLVPEVADMLAREAPEVLLLAAGGIADGRGLAASLMLGADGVLCGTAFWAAEEALVPEGQRRAAMAASGDATCRSSLWDVARGIDWPDQWNLRGMRTDFQDGYEGRLEALAADETARAEWLDAAARGDAQIAGPIVGEAIGLLRQIRPAATILETMIAEAAALLGGGWQRN
ncbi:nitronate monooxygenase [Pseudooceanicola antarcticus]|uniref:Nitronate monooxygenase n=1 Tax=Pseudooceanicola antarcticus TaxID=1247613 RepID=A0A285J2C5_9RHOB|nr:nitronate monooxygenase [Pseudooceanicola antarcticus]PJE29769.1 nitronate monooxygenase [Pseudooceanicola antarcticus]SNY54459.1 nitronate monooxygenase [Pseudooceanicola antarcticus]